MADGVCLESIEIESSPGVPRDAGFVLRGLSPGVSIIHGPNGIGKSTTSRAARDLIWGAEPTPGVSLSADVLHGDQRWRVELNLRGRFFLREGHPVPDPGWARADTRGRHAWSLRDLMESEDGDLARKVASALQGGVDLDETAKALGWSDPTPSPRKLANEVTEAAKRVRDLRNQQQDLLRRAEETRALEEEERALRDTAARRPRIEAALNLHRLQSERAEVKARLTSAPPGMEDVRPDDADALLRKQESLASLERETRRLEGERGALSPGNPAFRDASDGELKALGDDLPEALRSLAALGQSANAKREAFVAMDTKVANLRERLGLDPGVLETEYGTPELRTYLDARLKADAARLLATEYGEPPDPLPETSENEIRTAEAEILRLLRAPRTSDPLWWIALGLLFALTGHAAWLRLEPWWLALPLVPAILLVLRSLNHNNLLHEFNSRWPCSLSPPDPNDPSALRERLEELDLIRHCLRANALEAEAAALIPALGGITPRPDPRWAAHFLTDIQEYRSLLNERAASQRLLEDAESERAGLATDIVQRLAAWTDAPPDDPETAWKPLRAALQTELRLRETRKDLELEATQLRQRLDDLLPERDAILTRLNLDEPDVAEVQRRVSRLDAWRKDFRDSETLRHRTSELRKDLETDPGLLEIPPAELERLRTECDAAAVRADEMREQITRLDQDTRHARAGHDMHEALERWETLRDRLEEERNRAISLGTGRLLVDWLREQTLKNDCPHVLEEANRILARVTGGGLQLGFAREGNKETFRASQPGHPPRSLNQLSSGERAQALMAVRLAFLEHSDSTGKLPLFVDEALGSSDDDRARRVMDALIDTAHNGRQVLYFTAQLDEVAKWRDALSDRDLPWTVIDLAKVRGRSEVERLPLPPSVDPPAPTARPEPAESAEDWARRVGIPAPDPRAPIEDVHLWHVVRDPGETAAWMDRGLTRWGSLRALMDTGSARVPEEKQREWQFRAVALDARHKAWRVGRPRPLTADDLARSGSVSDAFLEGMVSLIHEVSGDASGLLDALEAGKLARWRQSKTGELREWLETQNLLPNQLPLSEEEIRVRELAALERAKTEWLSTNADFIRN